MAYQQKKEPTNALRKEPDDAGDIQKSNRKSGVELKRPDFGAEEIARFGKDLATPPGFWRSEPGIAEIRCRLDLWLSERGVLPLVNELRGIGIYGTYAESHFEYERWLQYLGYGESELRLLHAERVSRLSHSKGSQDAESPTKISDSLRDKAAEAVRLADVAQEGPTQEVKRLPKVTLTQTQIRAYSVYGFHMRPPKADFWLAPEGATIAYIRVVKFHSQKHRFPNEQDFTGHELGLAGFYRAQEGEKMGAKAILSLLGFDVT